MPSKRPAALWKLLDPYPPLNTGWVPLISFLGLATKQRVFSNEESHAHDAHGCVAHGQLPARCQSMNIGFRAQ